MDEFADSWTAGIKECLPPPPPVDPCEDGSPEYEQAEILCEIIIDEYGESGHCLKKFVTFLAKTKRLVTTKKVYFLL